MYFLLRRANAKATNAPMSAAPRTPPTVPPTVAEWSTGQSAELKAEIEFDEQVVFAVEEFVAVGASVVTLYVVLTADVDPGSRSVPICEVDIIDELSLQQFVVSDAARQQNLPGSHCKTDHEY